MCSPTMEFPSATYCGGRDETTTTATSDSVNDQEDSSAERVVGDNSCERSKASLLSTPDSFSSCSENNRGHAKDGVILVTSSVSDFSEENSSSKGAGGSHRSGGSWVEQIQFKAHYQHYRSIDYASIVNSSVSLDRVGVEPSSPLLPNLLPPPPRVIATLVADHTSSPQNKTHKEEAEEEERGRGLCWNFPRVKLRRLFNAKSLDDILGRSSTARKGTQSSESSNNSIIITTHQPRNKNALSQSNLSTLAKDQGLGSYSTKLRGGGSGSGLGARGLSGATSESNVVVVTGEPQSLFAVQQQQQQRQYQEHHHHHHHHYTQHQQRPLKNSTTTASTVAVNCKGRTTKAVVGRVKGAKSDNCLHRIVSSTCTKLGSNSVDNLDSTAGGGDGRISCEIVEPAEQQQQQQEWQDNVKSVPVSVQVRKLERTEVAEERPQRLNNSGDSRRNSGERIQRKRTQVSPVQTNNNNNSLPQLVSPSSDEEMTKERAKLVVANVGYLQRPLSPTPALLSGTGLGGGGGGGIPANNNVFKVLPQSPAAVTSPPVGSASGGGGGGGVNRNEFYSPPGTVSSNNTQLKLCANSSSASASSASYSYHNYNNQNQIKLERPTARHLSPGRVDNERLSAAQNVPGYNNNSRALAHGRQQGYDGGGGGGGPASWSDSRGGGPLGNKYRFRPESPPAFYSQQPQQSFSNTRISAQANKMLPSSDFPPCDSTLTGRISEARVSGKCVEGGRVRAQPRHQHHHQDFPAGQTTTTTTEEESMGDLQSPQYVKRTAHMFDSRYTSQVNGSGSRVSDDQRLSTTHHHHHNNNQPSYLSVSRSVCGYSCLSYNNGTTTTTTMATAMTASNGVSTTSGYNKSKRTSGVSSASDFSTTYRPGTLQASNNGSHFANSSPLRREPLKPAAIVSTPTMIDVENSQNLEDHQQQQQQPQGLSRKSNILEKIERLYGTNAVTTASLWRRPVPLMQIPSADGTSPPANFFKSFNSPDNNMSTTNGASMTTTRASEKIIPILLEGARTQLRRNGSEGNDGGKDDDDDDHTAKSQLTSMRISSTEDKVGDNIHGVDYGDDDNVDHAEHPHDDLYSKHQILHSNRRERDNNNANGQDVGNTGRIQTSKIIKVSSPPPRNLDAPVAAAAVVTNRPVTITSRIIREAASPSAKLNVTPKGDEIHIGNLDQEKTLEKSTEEKDNNREDIMGKDLFPPGSSTSSSGNSSEAENSEQVPAAQTEQKTDDSLDGETMMKPVFRIVSNFTPRDDGDDEKRVVETVEPQPEIVVLPKEPSDSCESVKENLRDPAAAQPEKNGEYFIRVLQEEKNHILGLIKTAEARLESLEKDGSDDVELSGQILATIGKARLLINKKFKQFEGLCNDNIEQRRKGIGESEPYTTKNEDLEGFWDMVLIQVDQIHSMFQNFDSNKESHPAKSTSAGNLGLPKKTEPSRRISAQKMPVSTPKTSTPAKSKSSGNTARDESRRKMLAERRKAMKDQLEAQNAEKSPDVQIFVQDAASEH